MSTGFELNSYFLGRQFRIKFDKEYFIGKFALQKQLSTGVYRRLVHFTLDDDFDAENDVWPFGGGKPYFEILEIKLGNWISHELS